MTDDISGDWRIARGCEGGACVEVGTVNGVPCVRDTTDRGGTVLSFPAGAWTAFTGGLKAGAA